MRSCKSFQVSSADSRSTIITFSRHSLAFCLQNCRTSFLCVSPLQKGQTMMLLHRGLIKFTERFIVKRSWKLLIAHLTRGPGKFFSSTSSSDSGKLLLAGSMYTWAGWPWLGSLGNIRTIWPPGPKLARIWGTVCLNGVLLNSSTVMFREI